jgi:hypothetical protein
MLDMKLELREYVGARRFEDEDEEEVILESAKISS